ncbi:hypothetical protein HPB52_009016 [Rhipicephalus sanguineus]|uniref:Secreted protein n=2 Tax=Rhipicephalus sanguineus TaxID=34632 RepID=A0A9D4Q5T3_RHISA|nr:hypothetical protein HPB52_009016 [Rhipicephalus sanguineus]
MRLIPLTLIAALLANVALVNGYSVYINVTSEAPTDVVQASRSDPALPFPVVLAFAAPVIALALGALKPVLLAVGLIFLTFFGLMFVPVLGEALQASLREFGSALTESLPPSLGRDMLPVVGLDTEACRTRAVCEITEEAVRKHPTVAAMLRSLTAAVQAHGNSESLLKGLLGGLSGLGCESLYPTCAQSPFDEFLEMH